MNASIITTLGCLFTSTLAGSLLFVGTFETADYTPNAPLTGQDNWVSLASPNAAVIVDDPLKAKSGRRAIECWGGGPLQSFSLPGFSLLDGAWEQVVEFGDGETPSRVRVEANVRLVGPDTGNGPGDDLASANLYARNGAGRSAFFFLSSNGNAYCFANSDTAGSIGYAHETPIKLGEYNHLAIDLDYTSHVATFSVNGKQVGTLPFGGAGEKFHGALLEFAALDDLRFIDPKQYTAYWDDVSVLGISN